MIGYNRDQDSISKIYESSLVYAPNENTTNASYAKGQVPTTSPGSDGPRYSMGDNEEDDDTNRNEAGEAFDIIIDYISQVLAFHWRGGSNDIDDAAAQNLEDILNKLEQAKLVLKL